MTSLRQAWRTLLILCLADFVAYMAIFAVPPILGDLVQHFHISYAQAGLCMTVYAIVRMLASLLAGTYSDRYGVRYFIWIGLILVAGAGYASALSPSFTFLLVCRVLIGIGATAIFIPGLAASMFLLPPRQVNLATGAFFSSLYLGLSVALLSTPILAARSGWQFPLKLFAGATVAVGILFLLFTSKSDLSLPAASSPVHTSGTFAHVTRRYSIRNIPLLLVSAAYFLMLFQSYGMITWLPEYLKTQRNYSPSEVGSVSMLLGLILIPGSVFAGWLGDRVGTWLVGVLGAIGCAICPAVLILFPQLSLGGVFSDVFLLALGTSLLVVPLTTILTHLVAEEDTGKAVGLVHTTGYAGSIASTYLGGYLLTLFGTYRWTFGIYAGSMLLTLLLLFFLKQTYREARLAR
jgi:predicted MFS family arabinose efflux permease